MPIHEVNVPDGSILKVDAPDGASDDQILAFAQQEYYKNLQPAQPAVAPTPQNKERSWGEALITDPLASVASGVGSLAQLPGQIGQLAGFVKPEETSSGLMGAGKDLQQWAEKQKSEGLKQKQAQLQADIGKQEGFFNEAATAIKGTLTDPALLSSFLFEQVPNLAGGLGGGMIARGATKALLADATEAALQKAAVRGAVGTSAVQQGADVGSGTYEQTYEALIAKGVDSTTANQQALTAAREAALGATVASLGAQFIIPGGQTLERAFLGRGLERTGGIAKGLVGESGSEAFEEGAGQFLSNLAQSQYLPETDLMKGVGASAGLGGVLGGIMGGLGGATLRGQPTAVEETPELPALESKALGLPQYNEPGQNVTMPDGSYATPEQAAEFYRQQEQAQFDQRLNPDIQFAQANADAIEADRVRQQELADLQVQRQQLAAEVQAVDAEQTTLNENLQGKLLTPKEEKIAANLERQLQQRKTAAEKAAAKLAEQERKAFLKAQQQELSLPTEIEPAAVEGQPDLFASSAQTKLDDVVKQADEGQPQAQYMLRDAGATYTPQIQQAAETIRSELTPFLEKVGLGHVGLQLVDSINNGKADGAYFRNIIQVAMDSPNPMATLRHETIHALNEVNAFDQKEWGYLNKMAQDKWIKEFIPAEKQAQYKEQYAQDNGSEAGFDQYLQEEAIAEAFRSFGDKPAAGILKRIFNKLKGLFDATGNWFRGNGFNTVDSIFSGVEAGRYAPTQEAVAQAATAEPAAPKFQLTNAPPSRSTKTTENKSAGKAVRDSVESVMKDDKFGTNLRIKYADVSSGLANVLAKAGLARIDENGQLRADLLHHAKAQTINLIKNMMVTGLPMITKHGTLGIERSEKTLARAQQIADSLANNSWIKSSGLNPRDFVAEVALALRAREIQKDDARRNAKGVKQLAEAKAKRAEAKKIAGGNPKEFHALMMEAAKLEKKGLKAEAKAVRKEAREKSRGNITVYKALLEEARNLSREGYLNKNLKREYRTTPEKLAWADKQVANVPELNQIFDIWRTNNHAAIDLQESVGLLTKKQADEYKSHEHYIPLFKSAEDLDTEGLFARGGTGAKSVPKQKKLVKGTHDVNVWENVDKQMARMVAAAYENQTRRIAAEQLVGVGAARETNKSNPNVNLRFMRDGKEISLIVEDDTVVAAFQSANYAVNPIFKSLVGGTTTALRYGALLNPMFWLRQIIRDPMHSTMVTETTTTPFHSMKNFAEIIMGRESDAYRTLVEQGVIGEVGNTLSIDDYLKSVGKSSGKKETNIQKALHKLLQIHESSDAATRVAIYNDAFKKAKAKGMSEEDAKGYAVMAAREAINFAVQGNSPTLAYLRQMIPFLSAAISSLDTVYKAASGYGLNAEEKKQVQQLFMRKAAIFSTFVLAYAMLYQDDEDYKKLPDNIKDNNFLFPIPSPSEPGKKVFIKIPTPFEIGFLLKTIPEAAVRYMAGTSTGEEVLKSYMDGFLHNVPGNGIPVPQIAKPLLENWTNYSFYTGKPLESMGDLRLPPEMRGTNSSEFAKQIAQITGYSPKKIDNLISGYFAEAGTSAAGIASYMIHAATGTAPPAKNFEEIWGIKSFVTNPNVDKAISDFYEIDGSAKQTVAEFNELKKSGDYKAIERFVQDEDKMRKMAAEKALSRIGDALGKVRAQIRLIQNSQSISPEERRQIINQLQGQQAMLAESGVSIAQQLGVR